MIVLDGNQRSALAAVRSLGKRGIAVTVGAESQPSLASVSRYCRTSFLYPSPYQDPAGFIAEVQRQVLEGDVPLLFPMTDVTVSEVLKNAVKFKDISQIPFPRYSQYNTASNKEHLFLLAKRIGIPVPRTVFNVSKKDTECVIQEAKNLGFPLIIKPAFSRVHTENGWINTSVHYANSANELNIILNKTSFRKFPFIIQERIEGPGVGVFFLLHNGEILAQFAHRRLREKPPSGGVSVLCEGIEPPPEALEAAKKLLRALDWSGVAMVEFKWDKRENLPKLMEINARFWGSLQLAVSSGVDFPYLLYCLVKGEKMSRPGPYKTGVKSRWEFGDLDHLLIRLKNNSRDLLLPEDAPPKFTVLRNFLQDFVRPSVRHEVFRPDDPSPFFHEAKQYLTDLLSKS